MQNWHLTFGNNCKPSFIILTKVKHLLLAIAINCSAKNSSIFLLWLWDSRYKQKKEVLDIMDEAWISFLLDLFEKLLLLSALLSFWNHLFWVVECCNLFPLINVTPIHVGPEQYKGVMGHDVYFDAFCRNTHLWKKWSETSLREYLVMHFTEYALLVLPLLGESFFSFGQLSMAQG